MTTNEILAAAKAKPLATNGQSVKPVIKTMPVRLTEKTGVPKSVPFSDNRSLAAGFWGNLQNG